MTKETIKSLTKKGWSQKKIAKTLGIRKMKVVTYQKAHAIGKRVESPFWKDVRFMRDLEETTWDKARKSVFNAPKWARKRAERQGKEYKSFSEFWKEWKEKWKDATQPERDAHTYEAVYGEEGGYVGGTPH